jgi:hypothetical protein
MAKERAQREAEDRGFCSPLEMAQAAFHDFQNGPKIRRPELAESFFPVVGPAWEAVADLQDGNYAGAGFNTLMAAADVLPGGVVVKGLKAASKGVGIFKKGSLTSGAAIKQYRNRLGIVGREWEVHHTAPLDGIARGAQNWRNHFVFLKPLPQEIHRRLHGSWNGKPKYDPIRRIWYGTTDWQKAVPTGIAGYAADAWENLTEPFSEPSSETDR